ncbi:MAG: heme ABC exporter ATP-binding protein CcmA [Deltaproteobacteria bacterium]|nr:heme ABC exporter ATP-binding protein CcmA [Deltaproteobacteria bacterium]
MKNPVIELKNLGHRYAGTWALHRLSLQIDEGEVVAILGPNGCGKTTLLKILATRLAPTCGEGTLLGHPLSETAPIRKGVKWLGHELGLYKALTAEENLDFFAKISGQKILGRQLDILLEKVGLQKNRREKVAAFSTGMKKRLSLARILMENPQILLFDEPHTNLDQEGKKRMSTLILERKKAGCTVLFSSHDHPETIPLCDKILALNHGRLVYFGPPGQIPKDVIL